MICPHCGKTIGPIHLTAEKPASAQDNYQDNYDELNPPPLDDSDAPPDAAFAFDRSDRSGTAKTNRPKGQANGSISNQPFGKDIYHELYVYVHAESDKALLLSENTTDGKTALRFEKIWFPKSQINDEFGETIREQLFLGWRETNQHLQLSGWILDQKEIPV